MLSTTEINTKFSAVKEHGEEVATAFKAFVTALDNAIPDGVAKTKLVNSLETASGWAHTALADGEAGLQKLAHLRAKSGAKPVETPPVVVPVAPVAPVTPVVETPPAA